MFDGDSVLYREMFGKFYHNILFYLSSFESYVEQIKQVLFYFLKSQLFVKGKKCELQIPTISFLAYGISLELVSVKVAQ